MKSMEAYKAQMVVRDLVDAAHPAEAIRALAMRADDPDAGVFQRYAGRVLRDAGALHLTDAGAPELQLKRTADGQLVQLTARGNAAFGIRGAQEQEAVRVLEDALNRLMGIVAALQVGVGAPISHDGGPASARRRQMYEIRGAAFPLWSDAQRGTQVTLPPLGGNGMPTEAFFTEIDWRMLDTVANNAHLYFQSTILANTNQVIFGVKALPGTEWDVRTRIAAALGNLEPSLRLTHRFDCDTECGLAVVHFTVPSSLSFPAWIAQAPYADEGIKPVGNLMKNARLSYAVRMATLVGAACFGGGRTVSSVLAIGKDADGTPLVSCTFQRERFVRQTLPVIDAGVIASSKLRFDPQQLKERLEGAHVEFPGQIPNKLGRVRVGSWRDERELPHELMRLFHAKRICDIDTGHYLGGAAQSIDAAREDSHDSLMAAIVQLESLVEDLEAKLEPPDDLPDARPLYCDSALSRLAIALLDDELDLGAQAEAFLANESDALAMRLLDADPVLGASLGEKAEPETGVVGRNAGARSTRPRELPDVFYYRAPHALFHAHLGLSDLYRRLGDARGAESQADRCIALAPSMPVGYAMKADALAGRGRFGEAENVIRLGMRVVVADNDRAMLLHDLAVLLWRMDRKRQASALHIQTAQMTGVYARNSAEFVKRIANGRNLGSFLHENRAEAAEVVAEMELPLISERTANALIARAALGLANAHAPNAAAPYAELLSKRFPINRTVVAACNSIRFGLG